jgi:23S rRNA-/tRNA-specific pseudouridylate synthase
MIFMMPFLHNSIYQQRWKTKRITFDEALSSLKSWFRSDYPSYTIEHVVDDTVGGAGCRACEYLGMQWFGTKSRAADHCKDGYVRLNGRKIYGTTIVKSGDKLSIDFQSESDFNLSNTKVIERLSNYTAILTNSSHYMPPAHVLYEDDDVGVLYKPNGIHSMKWISTMSKNRYAFDDILPLLLYHPLSFNNEDASVSEHTQGIQDTLPRPIPCHRLDARVSGCIVIAKSRTACRELTRQFEQRIIKKEYHAILAGRPVINSEVYGGRVAFLDSTHETTKRELNANDKVMVTFPLGGKEACTLLQVVDLTPCNIYGTLTTVKLVPHTGRRHQLRQHCSILQCPIIGDDLYHDCSFIEDINHRLQTIDEILKAVNEKSQSKKKDDDVEGSTDSELINPTHSTPDVDLVEEINVSNPEKSFPKVRKNAGLFLTSTGVAFFHPRHGHEVKVTCDLSPRFYKIREKARKGHEWKLSQESLSKNDFTLNQ